MAKVLIVDDSLFIRSQLDRLLTEHGYETVLAEDGEQAISLYASARPDIVLMDITMPKVNGLDALAQIHVQDPGAKVIMLTALDQGPIASRAVHMGAKDFLVKPILPANLLMALHKVLR